MEIVLTICIVVAVLVIGYFLAIMPGMTEKSDALELRKWLYAHRGLHDNKSDAPENSLAAFQKAVDAGFGIELDIQLSKDKVPVVMHDFDLKRNCGVDGKVYDYTYEELQQFTLYESQEKIPKFEDVLKLVDGKVPLIVEFKIETSDLTLCPIADKLLREYKGLYCMESFNPFCVKWYRKNRKEVVRGQLADAFMRDSAFRKKPMFFGFHHLLFNFMGKPDFVAYNHWHANVLSRRICRGLYHNLAVAWTIKSEEQLQEARKHFDMFIFDSFVPK